MTQTPYDMFTEEELQATRLGPGEVPDDVKEDFAEADATIGESPKKSVRHRQYEKKVRKLLAAGFRYTAANENTVSDAAAIIIHGPDFADSAGALADKDERFRRGIDMLTDGSENPYLAFAIAAVPFAMQIYRNHEKDLQPSVIAERVKQNRAERKERAPKEYKIPFTNKRLQIKFRFQFPAMQVLTNEPTALADYVFSNPNVQQMIHKQDIKVAWTPSKNGSHAR